MAADRNSTTKKAKAGRPTLLVSAPADAPVADAFDDEALDDVLRKALRAGEQPPRLIVVDRLANRTRYRREC